MATGGGSSGIAGTKAPKAAGPVGPDPDAAEGRKLYHALTISDKLPTPPFINLLLTYLDPDNASIDAAAAEGRKLYLISN